MLRLTWVNCARKALDRKMKKDSARNALRVLLTLGLGLAASGRAGAVDWYTGDKTSEPDYSPAIVLDASGSLARKSDFGAVAVTGALDGTLRQSGFLGRAEFVGGGYAYDATTAGFTRRINATQISGGALVGYNWVAPHWTFALFGGAQVVDTTLNPFDPNNATHGTHVGAKFVGEFYGNPTERTMFSGYASYGTANSDYYTRFKAGYAIARQVFIGPEFLALGDRFYTEYRAGLHVTGVSLGALTLGLSGGFTSNRVTGSGGYGVVDARFAL
jgi:hypothetical protein